MRPVESSPFRTLTGGPSGGQESRPLPVVPETGGGPELLAEPGPPCIHNLPADRALAPLTGHPGDRYTSQNCGMWEIVPASLSA